MNGKRNIREGTSKVRYLLFSFYDYYPEGGLDDIALITDDIDEVKERIRWFGIESETYDTEMYHISNSDNIQVYDTEESKVVYSAHKSIRKWTKDIIEEVNLVGA